MALDAEQVIKRVADATLPDLRLRGTDMGAATAPKPVSHLDAKQILKRVYVNATRSLRLVHA